jgi:cytoskeletal protein CcmA (bactofilin family)
MSCPSELNCSAFVDGALASNEALGIERHIESCSECHALIESLSAERALLRNVLQHASVDGVIPAFVPRPTISRLLVWLCWAAIGIWAVSMAWSSLMSVLTLPDWLAWLSPSAIGTSIGLLSTTLLPGTSVADITSGMIGAAQSMMVAVIALFGFGWLVRHQPGRAASPLIAVSALSLLLTVAPESQAFELRRDEQRVVIAADEVVDDTLIVTSEDIVIDGTVTGDLIAAGESLSIRGRVDGIVLAAGESVQIEGVVGGSVFSAGETIDVRGASLAGNFFGAGEKVVVHDDTEISGNAALAGEEVDLRGSVGRDLRAAGSRVTVTGSVEADMSGYAATVELTDTAHIGGDLTVKTKTEESAIIAPGATIDGATDIDRWPEEPSRYATPGFYLGEILHILAAFVTGLVLFRFVPALGQAELEGSTEALVTAAIGALVLIGTPILAVIAMITLIGAPLGLLTFLLWLATLYAAGIVIACYIGRLILPNRETTTLPLLLGLVLLVVVTNLPIIGGPIQLVAGILGLGLIGQWLREIWLLRAA